MVQATQQTDTSVRRLEMPLACRYMEVRDFQRVQRADDADGQGEDKPLARARLVASTGAAVRRYDWYRERPYIEQLVVEPGAVRLTRLERGAPLLNSHWSWHLENVLGVTENPTITDGAVECDATFSRRDSVAGYVQDVADGVIRNVSVGYVYHRVEMVPPEEEGGLWTYRVIDWEPYEVSLVPIPADMDAQVKRSGGGLELCDADDQRRKLRTFPCEFIEVERPQRRSAPTPMVGTPAATTRKEALMADEIREGGATTPATAQQQPTQADDAVRAAAEQEARQRAADITELCARHGVPQLAAGLIRNGATLEAAREAVLDELAKRDAASGGHRNVRVETVRDQTDVQRTGILEALMHRLDARSQLTDNGRQYRGMSLLEIGREYLESHGVRTRGWDRLRLADEMLHFRSGAMGTSDFPHLLANVANKRMRVAYEEAPATYTIWARRAPNAPDFKEIKVVQLSGAPDLMQTNEHGEFKYGAMGDDSTSYKVVTYGRIVPFTRQAIINDDLRGFDRLITAFGASARRLENRLVYAQLTSNPKMSDNVDLFHASHNNLITGADSVLGLTGLNSARSAMRKQTGLQGEKLNIAPAYLIVPTAHEHTAYQYTSPNFVPATSGAINEFARGGRTPLEPVVEPLLDDASAVQWYLAASSSQIDTVEYCFLDGAEGPVIEERIGFETDGIEIKCREDFAAKVIDWRGLVRSNNG